MNTILKYFENAFNQRHLMMGVAMIMVILYHLFNVVNSKCLAIFYPGFMGVDIFLFLSGYGLCFAFNKYDLPIFYKRRILRIIPLFVLMAFIVTLIKVSTGQSANIWDWFCNLSTLSYYQCGGFFVDWYLSALLLFYLTFPLLYRLMKHRMGGGRIILLTIAIVLTLSSLFDIEWYYETALGRLPFFMSGILCYITSKEKAIKSVCSIYGIALLIALILYSKGYIATYMVVYMSAPFILIAVSWFIEIISPRLVLKRFIEYVGKHSLEFYTANVCICLLVIFVDNTYFKIIGYFVLHLFLVPLFTFADSLFHKVFDR